MSDTLAGTKRRRARNDPSEGLADLPETDVVEARKRRAFLHTMGQQLREFGNEGVSPQDQSRNTFPSPGGRPASRAADSAISQATVPAPNDGASGEDDQLPAGAAYSASRWLWRTDEVQIRATEGSRLPLAFEDFLEWSQSYFDHWHPSFPFLHAPALLDHFKALIYSDGGLSNPSSLNSFDHIILRSVMSIAAMDRRQMAPSHKPVPSEFLFQTFNDAINSVQPILTEESSILSLQALVSVQLFLISMNRYNAASRLQGISAHLTFQLHLYKCPGRTCPPTDKEAELRKRLFWSVFCIDRYISIRLGNPSVISSEDIDVCYPQSERHNQGHIDVAVHDDRLDLIDFLARHADIRGSIMKIRNKTTLTSDIQDDDQALLVETEHAKWWTTVDEHLSDYKTAQSIAKPHQVTLIVLRFETILALHRSILGNPKHDTVFNAALQRCITASRSIINTLHKALKGFGAFDGSPGQHGYESSPLLWPSFTWAIWMSTFVVIFAASEKHLSHKIAFGLAERSIEVLQYLALRGTSWPESCIVGIRNLVARLKRAREGITGAPRSEILDTNRPGRSEGPSQSMNPRRGRAVDSGSTADNRLSNSVQLGTTEQCRPAPQSSNQRPPGTFDLSSMDQYTALQGHVDPDAFLTTNNYIVSSGDFLGIAQQSSDVPRPNEDITQMFNKDDLSWWMGPDYGLDGLL
ncbi:fungal-specific transcription factor domain-containing protein [Boeremia exigua]|uniref:fungal-specific transcription factor domain-containing protein n=1 Tax=Boeremia exigua TaxID=749465 RepID=UPI001E8ECF0E|nr:fungal-specific transcription factor domain-containing protein [Boeremia exigua]KAH6625552.1 fungal-specific transcription factor domain-containing protein [Boeremia exigua]